MTHGAARVEEELVGEQADRAGRGAAIMVFHLGVEPGVGDGPGRSALERLRSPAAPARRAAPRRRRRRAGPRRCLGALHRGLDRLGGRLRRDRRLGRVAAGRPTCRQSAWSRGRPTSTGPGKASCSDCWSALTLRRVRRGDRVEHDEHGEQQRHHVVARDEPALVVLVLLVMVLLMQARRAPAHLTPPASGRSRPRPAPPRRGARTAGRRPSASPRRRAGCRRPGCRGCPRASSRGSAAPARRAA